MMGVCRCYIPKRYILTALSFMGMFCIFAMRVSLSVTIVAMVNNTDKVFSNITNFEVECPNLIPQTQVSQAENFIGPQYNWDAKKQGLILGAFYYGYVITQLPLVFFSEKVGAKWLFGGGVLNTAIFCLLTPLIASWSATAFIIARIWEGLGEGGTFPAINLLIGQWSPKMERSRLSTIIFTGNQIGNVLSMPIAGWLSSIDLFGGWPSVFYLFGTMSCIWFVFWAILVHETPAKHPTISLKELEYFQENNDGPSEKKPETPWRTIFSSLPMWAVLIAHVGHDLGFLIFLADLPTYLSTILHFNIKENGVLSALPFVVQAITAWIASYCADTIRRLNILSITNIRKVFTSVGLLGPAGCLLIITVSGCRPYLIISLITLGMALNGFVYSGFNVTHVDMSPTFAGTTYAITNTAACFCGFIGPAIVGFFTDKGATIENWNSIFYITAGTYAVAAVFFAAFASAELQPWGTGKEDTKL